MDQQRYRADMRRAQRERENSRRRQIPATQVASYVDRDGSSGYRRIIQPDGGVGYANYLSNSAPEVVPGLSIGGRLGRPGIISSKPA
jgi:hypothetical protein